MKWSSHHLVTVHWMTNLYIAVALKSGGLTSHGSLWSFLYLLCLCKHSPVFPHLFLYRKESYSCRPGVWILNSATLFLFCVFHIMWLWRARWNNIHHTLLEFVLQTNFFKLSFHALQDMHSMHIFYHTTVFAMLLWSFPITNMSNIGNKL